MTKTDKTTTTATVMPGSAPIPGSPRTMRRRKRDNVILAGNWVKVQCFEVVSILWEIIVDVVSKTQRCLAQNAEGTPHTRPPILVLLRGACAHSGIQFLRDLAASFRNPSCALGLFIHPFPFPFPFLPWHCCIRRRHLWPPGACASTRPPARPPACTAVQSTATPTP